MKLKPLVLLFVVILAKPLALAQGTFVYDQQSADENTYKEGTALIQQNQPFGQSFTPSLSAVGFIQLTIFNGFSGNYSQANIVVNLRSDSVSGQVLGTSQIVSIPGGALFFAPVNFIFDSPISVTPGVAYYFQPEVLNNNNLVLNAAAYNYSGGMAFVGGLPYPSDDLWFREGIIVPEPTALGFLFIGSAIGVCFGQRQPASRRRLG
jgi:hypothetical protein